MTEAHGGLSCEEVERSIQEALGVPDLPAVARHMEACAACSEAARDLADLAQGLRSLPLIEPAPGFWERLTERVLERGRSRRPQQAWGLSAIAAAALVLVMIVPPDREQWSLQSAGRWLAEVAISDYAADPLDTVRSAEEAVHVARRIAMRQGFGEIEELAEVTERDAVRRPETPVWNLLDNLNPGELELVVARLEKGAGQ